MFYLLLLLLLFYLFCKFKIYSLKPTPIIIVVVVFCCCCYCYYYYYYYYCYYYLQALACPEYESSQRVSVFLSMDSEIDTGRILTHILESRRECFVPYYKGPVMKMLKLHSLDDYHNLPETKWHIKQPRDATGWEDAAETGQSAHLVIASLDLINYVFLVPASAPRLV